MSAPGVRQVLVLKWLFGHARTNLEVLASEGRYFMANRVVAVHQGRGDDFDFDQSKGLVQVPISWYGHPKESALAVVNNRLEPFAAAGLFEKMIIGAGKAFEFYFSVPVNEDYRVVFCQRARDVFEILGIAKTHFTCPKVDEYSFVQDQETGLWLSTSQLVRTETEKCVQPAMA